MRAGREPVEPLGQLDVGLVGRDREADVGEPVELLADRLDDAGVPVTGVDHADAAAEIDQAVAVGVGQHRAFGVHDGDGRDGGHAPRHRLGAAGQEGAAVGAGDLGLQVNDAGHDGPRTESVDSRADDASSRAERGTCPGIARSTRTRSSLALGTTWRLGDATNSKADASRPPPPRFLLTRRFRM